MTKRIRSLLKVSAVGVVFSLLGCGRSVDISASTPGKEQPQDAPIRYVKVAQQQVPETLELAAKVQPDPTKIVRIFPPASGRVIAIAVKPGEHVRRGETVAILSSSDIATAQSDFAKANIEAERATRTMDREKMLFEHGAAAEKDYIEAKAQAEAARAELVRTKQHLELLNVSPSATTDRVTLVAPAAGVVTDVNAAPGEFSKSLESANPLITIADLNTVWIVGEVYEKDLAKVSRGKQVTITMPAYPGRQWTGRIDSLSGTLDPTTRTLRVRVVLANPNEQLKPEMFGTIRVNIGTHQALVVPAAAIIREGGNTTVFVKTGAAPQQRDVTVGQAVDGQVEIVSGLQVGEEVAA